MKKRVRKWSVLLVATASMALLGAAPAAQADPFVSVSWELPSTMTAGGTATQDIVVTNYADMGESITLSPIWFVPSCGTTNIAPCDTPDIGVFSVDSPVAGVAGVCDTDQFPVVPGDTMPATGRIGIDPSPDLTLAAAVIPPGPPGESCTIHLALQVLRVPSYDSDPAMAGVQTRQALQFTVNGGSTSSAANQVTVNPGPTTPIVPGIVPAPSVLPAPSTATDPCAGKAGKALKLCKCRQKKSKARAKCIKQVKAQGKKP